MLNSRDLILTIDIINKCLRIKNIENLKELKNTLVDELGVESLIVGCSSQNNTLNNYFFDTNEEWESLYRKLNYSLVDPIYQHALKSAKPVSWSDAYLQADSSSSEFIEHAKQYNLLEGICYATTPHSITYSTAMASIGNGATPLTCRQTEILTQILPHLVEAIARKSLWDCPKLTPSEIEVAKWSALGKSYWEQSRIMSISERTVKFHMGNICTKLNATNKTQAVAKCMALGFVSI